MSFGVKLHVPPNNYSVISNALSWNLFLQFLSPYDCLPCRSEFAEGEREGTEHAGGSRISFFLKEFQKFSACLPSVGGLACQKISSGPEYGTNLES